MLLLLAAEACVGNCYLNCMVLLVGKTVQRVVVESAEGCFVRVQLVVTEPGFGGECGCQCRCYGTVATDWKQPDHKSKGSPVEMAEVLRKHGSLMIMALVEAAPVCRNELLRFLCGE